MHTPVALGGKANLTQKTAALLHSLSLEENPKPHLLQSYLDTVISFTVYMGVELQIANLVAPLEALAPLHWQTSPIENVEGTELDVMDEGAAKPPQPSKHLFSRALPVPGIQHITDNVLAEAHHKL